MTGQKLVEIITHGWLESARGLRVTPTHKDMLCRGLSEVGALIQLQGGHVGREATDKGFRTGQNQNAWGQSLVWW